MKIDFSSKKWYVVIYTAHWASSFTEPEEEEMNIRSFDSVNDLIRFAADSEGTIHKIFAINLKGQTQEMSIVLYKGKLQLKPIEEVK